MRPKKAGKAPIRQADAALSDTAAPYDLLVKAAFQELLRAQTPVGRQLAGMHFTRLVQLRNAERTPEEIARLERAKGLR